MVAGLLLSWTVYFGHWQRAVPLHHCLAASGRALLAWWPIPAAEPRTLPPQPCCAPTTEPVLVHAAGPAAAAAEHRSDGSRMTVVA